MAHTSFASFSGRLAAPAVLPLPAHTNLRGHSGVVQEKSTTSFGGQCKCGDMWSLRSLRTSAALVADAPLLPGGKGSGMETVGDVMTSKKVFSVKPNATIDEALEMLVENRITGLPVLNDDRTVVGIVSDFDLLSLDHISGERTTSGIFPDVSTDWQSFQEVQKLILKNHGKLVEDVMTPEPLVVGRETSLEKAARILLDNRIRRLPVVDSQGKLIGMFSRGDVIKAALQTRKQIKSVSGSIDEF